MSDIKKVIEQFIKDTTVSPLLNKPQDIAETQMRAARIRAAIPKILRAFYEGHSTIEQLEIQFNELKAEWDAFECECTGSPDNQGSGDHVYDADYNIIGEKNYINTVYTTRFNYILETTNVYVNGMRLTRGEGYDYIELGNKNIELYFPLFPSDRISINYITSAEIGTFITDYDYHLLGIKDGINRQFTVRNFYIPQTTNVFINGMKLTKGSDYDYIEIGPNKIEFNFPPKQQDLITVDYKVPAINTEF